MADPIMIRICDFIDRRTRAHNQTSSWLFAVVVQMVANRDTSFESGGITSAENRFGSALDQRYFAFQDI